jgi:hypothetical protein
MVTLRVLLAKRSEAAVRPGVIAASVHENEPDACLAANCLDDDVEGDRTRRRADVVGIEVDRDNMIDRVLLLDPIGLKSVSGVEEEADVGSLERGAKPLGEGVEVALAGVEPEDDLTIQAAQHLGHLLGVVERFLQRADAGVGGVADYERHAFFGCRGGRRGKTAQCHANSEHEHDELAHGLSPSHRTVSGAIGTKPAQS